MQDFWCTFVPVNFTVHVNEICTYMNTPVTPPLPPQVERLKDVILFRFQAPLIFINAGVFRARLEIASGLREVISERAGTSHQTGCLQGLYRKVRGGGVSWKQPRHGPHATVIHCGDDLYHVYTV